MWTCPAGDFIYGGAFSAGSERKTGGDLVQWGEHWTWEARRLHLTSFVTLWESRHRDKPQFPHPENGNTQQTSLRDLMKPKLANTCDSLAPK